MPPPKKSSLGRTARSRGKSKQKRDRTMEVLAAEIAVLKQQLANNEAEQEPKPRRAQRCSRLQTKERREKPPTH